VLVAACGSGIKTTADWNPESDFTAFQTYAWKPNSMGGGGIDQLTDSRVRAAIEADLNGKGLRKVALAQAALAVGYQITTQDQTDYTTMTTGWGGGWGRYGRGWGGGMATSTTTANTYTNGTLIVGLFDTKTQEVLWHGSGTAKLHENRSPEDRTESINSAVAKILEKFPPSN
jgi:hypothetical protein